MILQAEIINQCHTFKKSYIHLSAIDHLELKQNNHWPEINKTIIDKKLFYEVHLIRPISYIYIVFFQFSSKSVHFRIEL